MWHKYRGLTCMGKCERVFRGEAGCRAGLLPGGWLYQCGRVQVVDFVELQEGREVLKLLVAYLEPLTGQGVDDIVGHFGVLRHGQHVVAGASGRVSNQKRAVSLSL